MIFTNFLWQILNENNQNIKRNLWQKITRKQIEQLEKQTLKTYFGYDTFRPGQEVIVELILAGRDVLAVMPHRGRKIVVLSAACSAAAGNYRGGLSSDFSDDGSGKSAE